MAENENQIIIRGDSIYTIADGTSWNAAQASAEEIGGDLATINSAEENIFVFKNFGFDPSTEETISSGYWIGLTDQEVEGTWKWISGEEVEWVPPTWGDMEPSGNGLG